MNNSFSCLRNIAFLAVVTASCATSITNPAFAGKQSSVGIVVTNGINNPTSVWMELRVNRKLVASGLVRYHTKLWEGRVPSGANVVLTVKWMGRTIRESVTVTRHGTYIGPVLDSRAGFKIIYTPQ